MYVSPISNKQQNFKQKVYLRNAKEISYLPDGKIKQETIRDLYYDAKDVLRSYGVNIDVAKMETDELYQKLADLVDDKEPDEPKETIIKMNDGAVYQVPYPPSLIHKVNFADTCNCDGSVMLSYLAKTDGDSFVVDNIRIYNHTNLPPADAV